MKKFLILFLFFSLFALSGCGQNVEPVAPVADNVVVDSPVVSSTPVVPIPLDSIAPDEKIMGTCQENNGTWLNKYSECENISFKWCEKHGGKFNECGSACRHQAKDTVCTLQCVPFCDLSGNQSTSTNPIETPALTCGPCRTYSPPSPDWCKDGTIIASEKDRCGCVGHPICK